eukprot:scaffold27940_cov32-Tisochrysis_lutea.AAC.2
MLCRGAGTGRGPELPRLGHACKDQGWAQLRGGAGVDVSPCKHKNSSNFHVPAFYSNMEWCAPTAVYAARVDRCTSI